MNLLGGGGGGMYIHQVDDNICTHMTIFNHIAYVALISVFPYYHFDQ